MPLLSVASKTGGSLLRSCRSAGLASGHAARTVAVESAGASGRDSYQGSRRTIQPVPVLADLAAALRGPGLVEDPILFLPQKLVQKLRR